MKTDIEIAHEKPLMPIKEVAERFGIQNLELYGDYKAKLKDHKNGKGLHAKPEGKLVLVTAINPTPAGEGKTTTTIGLAQALNKLGKKTVVALREPSLGPCMGVKGGAAGGGYAQVVPMEDINLHFTGDFHAITCAHNLLSAMIDNSIHQGNELNIDLNNILWPRVLDMNDRSLREIVIGLGSGNGTVRQDKFIITVASEIMAILCLADDLEDLKERLKKIIVAYNTKGEPVTAGDLKAEGAMTVLLKDAIKPNLVQTLEHTPAIIHGGPFANIAHGCNSVKATKTALQYGEIVVTEAGFGADLGAEKFLDIKCRVAGLKPNAVVIVATVRALKYNGGVSKNDLSAENLNALQKGFVNLAKHMENIKKYGLPFVVAINVFPSDTEAELNFLKEKCKEAGAEFAISRVFEKGGQGGLELANSVLLALESENQFKFLYDLDSSIQEKTEIIAKEIYGAKAVEFSAKAKKDIKQIQKLGYGKLPVCIAKTQYSLSDNPALLGRPTDFVVNVREARLLAGAGFVVLLTGDIMTMPGLPKVPAAVNMDIDGDGNIKGLS